MSRTRNSHDCSAGTFANFGSKGILFDALFYFVRKDSGIEKIADMKGKVAATNGRGSGVDIAMRSASTGRAFR